ncbi:unnamed protein product [Echinostoma caproni]|uniref:GATA-type domain-containing protein n=1 Tax=Echinostoma caproni TaxID=27848 RepID=A0A183BFW7_9TREM|nr:unnamed protein product [Echinostoma caproni]
MPRSHSPSGAPTSLHSTNAPQSQHQIRQHQQISPPTSSQPPQHHHVPPPDQCVPELSASDSQMDSGTSSTSSMHQQALAAATAYAAAAAYAGLDPMVAAHQRLGCQSACSNSAISMPRSHSPSGAPTSLHSTNAPQSQHQIRQHQQISPPTSSQPPQHHHVPPPDQCVPELSASDSQMDSGTSSTSSMHQQALAAATAYAAAAAYAGLDPMVAAHQRVKAYYDHWASSLFGSLAANPPVASGPTNALSDYPHPVNSNNNRATDWSVNQTDRSDRVFDPLSADPTWAWPRDQTGARQLSNPASRPGGFFDTSSRLSDCTAAYPPVGGAVGGPFSEFSTNPNSSGLPNLSQHTVHSSHHSHMPATTKDSTAIEFGINSGHPGLTAPAYSDPILPHLSHPDPYRHFHPGLDYARFGPGPSSHEPRVNGWS